MVRGRQFGFLSYAAVSQVIGELELDGAEVEEVDRIERADIELIEELGVGRRGRVGEAGALDGGDGAGSQAGLTTDSVQLFFKARAERPLGAPLALAGESCASDLEPLLRTPVESTAPA